MIGHHTTKLNDIHRIFLLNRHPVFSNIMHNGAGCFHIESCSIYTADVQQHHLLLQLMGQHFTAFQQQLQPTTCRLTAFVAYTTDIYLRDWKA